MSRANTNDVAGVIDVYRNAYTEEWNRVRGTSTIRVVQHENPLDDSSPIKRVYENEGNFFLCGFNWLWFSGRNVKLRKALEAAGCRIHKGYPTGLDAVLPSFSLHGHGTGNGDYTIQTYAYGKAAEYLRSLGYDVHAESRLD